VNVSRNLSHFSSALQQTAEKRLVGRRAAAALQLLRAAVRRQRREVFFFEQKSAAALLVPLHNFKKIFEAFSINIFQKSCAEDRILACSRSRL
jgi:hypothetical protein